MGSLLDEKTTWEEFGGGLRRDLWDLWDLWDQGCQRSWSRCPPRGKQHLDRRLTKDAKGLVAATGILIDCRYL